MNPMSKLRAGPAGRVTKWAWERVPTPKVFTAAICGIYALLLSGWGSALFDPPMAPHGIYGEVTMYMVASLVTIGAVVALPAALFGNFRVERRAVITLGVGLVLFIVSRYALHMDDPANWIPQANTAAVSIVVIAVRLRHVWKRPVGTDEEVLMHTRSADHTC